MRALLLLAAVLTLAACDTNGDGVPRTAVITRIVVEEAPLSDPNGDGWDGGSNPLADGPEVYFRLFDAFVDYQLDPGADRLNPRDDVDVFALGSDQPWYEAVDERDFPLLWDVDPGYIVRDLGSPLYVALFDYDPTTGDDPMGETEVFTLFDLAPARVTGRAETIRLGGFDRTGAATGEVSVRITVEFFD